MLRVTGTVNQGVSGTITDTARVNYTDALGNPFAQVTATDVDNIVASSNLSITKTDSTDPENPGQSFFYTLTVNNAGPANATNLVVSDTVPSQYTVTSVTSPTGACGNVGNVVTCNLAAFASGAAAWVITVNVTVKATTVGGTYVNTATVSATEADPTPANNTVNNNNTVRTTGDLALTKTDGVASVTVGSSTTYTITVTNNGPDIEPAGVVISDTIPAGTVGSETEADCTIIAGVFRCTTAATLAVGASRSYQLTLTVPAGYAAATVVNTATITTFPITDPVAANNAATDTDTVPQANLSITKTDSIDPVNPGQSFSYTLTVNNAGPSTATSLVVSDTVPSQYTVTSVTSPTGACGNVGNVVTCTLASMISGAPAWVITVNVTVKITTPGGTYVNTATVSASTNDPTPANNTVNNNNTVRSYGDLTLTKTDGMATVTAGTSTTYTITITNNGPSTEPAGVRFTDTIPAGTVGSEAEADCAIAAGVFTCTTVATIASGATKSYQLTLAVPSGYAPATVVNTANITVRPITDPDLTNNSATDTDNVTRSADLSITKTDSADPVNPGQAFTYTLTVTNNGPSDAATLTVSDTVPAQFTVTNVTSPAGACGHAGNVVTCTRPTFVNLATWVITVSVTANLAAPGGTYTNTATVSAATADPTPANNSASQNTTISATADLAVTKTDGVASVVAGTSTTYTITLTNNGPNAVAAGVVVSDPIPAGTVGSESEPDCAIAAGTFTCTTSAVLNSGASVVYQLTPGGSGRLRAGDARQHGVDHVVPGHRSERGQQLRHRHRHRDEVGGSLDHEDRRRRVGDRGDVDDLHDHHHEQRSVERARGRGGLRPDPRGNGRFGVRARLRHRGRHVHVHDVGSDRLGWFGVVPADAGRRGELRAGEPVQHRLHHVRAGDGSERGQQHGHRHGQRRRGRRTCRSSRPTPPIRSSRGSRSRTRSRSPTTGRRTRRPCRSRTRCPRSSP